MKNTLLTVILAVSLASLSACQTTRIQGAKNTDTLPERNLAQAAAEGALESVIKNLASHVAAGNEEAFDQSVLKIINSNKATLGITTQEEITMSNLDANAGKATAFLNKLGKSNLLSSLNVSKNDLMTAAKQQSENAEVSVVGSSTLTVPDLTRPVSADSFKEAIAAGADPHDVDAIITAAKDLENKVGHPIVGSGCSNLRSPASIHNLQEVVTGTDAALQKGATQAQVDTELQAELAKVTNTDAAGAKERLCELADGSRCGVLKVDSKTCAE